MKFINILFLIYLIPMIVGPITPVVKDPYLVSDYIGPFDGSSDASYVLDAYRILPNFKINIKYCYANNNAIYAEENYQCEIQDYQDSMSHMSLNLTFPVKGYLNSRGIKVIYQIKDTKTVFRSYEVSIKKKASFGIDGNYYTNKDYTVEGYFYKLNGYEETITSETFRFNNIQDTIYNTKKNYLKFNSNSFYYGDTYPKKTQTGSYFVIEDTKNVFPYMNKSKNQVKIPLTLTRGTNKVTIKPNINLYVNEHTLQISNTSRSGFVAATKIYLPIMGSELLEQNRIYFSLTNLGRIGLNVSFTTSYINSYQFFGDCNHSTYCIGGGVS